MVKSYLVYKIGKYNTMTLVAEADNIELCNEYLKSDEFRIVTFWKKSNF